MSTPIPSTNNTKQIQQQLLQHLNVLYGANVQREQFESANRFLMEFNKHSNAWSICLSILSEITNHNHNAQNILILRYAAQTVYDGLLQHWGNVPIPQRVQIVSALQSFIQTLSDKYLMQYLESNTNNNVEQQSINSSFKFILNKICQCIAFLALNANEAPQMIESVFNSCSSIKLPQQLSLLWVNLEILNGFALEFEQQHVSIRIIKQTRALLTSKYRERFLNIITCCLQSAKQYQHTLYRLIELSFCSLKHWINIVDITLKAMESVGLLDEILNCIHLLYKHNEYLQCKQFMVDAIHTITIKGTLNRNDTDGYEQILNKICITLSGLHAVLNKAMEANDMNNIQSLCNLICGFAENEVQYIAKGSNDCLELIKMILQFTSHSSTIITTETFGFWSRLQDIPMNNRHESLRKDVYLELLRSLLLHSTDPEEFDEHSRFRQNSAEIFISIYFVVGTQFFVEIETRLKQLFGAVANANNDNDLDLIFVRIESCMFALAMIAQEVSDERNDTVIQQCLDRHIKPIAEALFYYTSSIYKKDINATRLHLLTQFTSFFRGYSFYICTQKDLLQKCLLFNIEIPTKYQPIMATPCSNAFKTLLYHSISIWMKQLNDFEQIIKSVTHQIGDGQRFYNKLSQNELELLKESDQSIVDPIITQHIACSVYYEALCMVIDIYNDQNRQKSLMNNLISSPSKICNDILLGLHNVCSNKSALSVSMFYTLLCNLRIFCGFIRGLKTCNVEIHPLAPHIASILRICVECIKCIPPKLSDINIEDAANTLYDVVCDVMEAVLDIFGSSTSSIIDGLVQISLEILKNTKSESSARILKKMVSTFSKQTNLANNFINLIKQCIVFFSNDNADDLRLFHKTVAQIFECVDIILCNYSNDNISNIWTLIVPDCIALSLKILTNIQDRDGLKSALKILKSIFDPKHISSLNSIGNELKQCLFSNVISVLFNGIALHFERMIANQVYDVYYNLVQWDATYVKQQTMQQLLKLKSNAFEDDNNKKLFITAFWAQRSNRRKFNLVLTTFFSVCHNFDTPDSFGGMIE